MGRDTRGSGPELEEAFARGVVAAGGNAVLAGVLPTPAVALLALDLGAVISASHNPPEYNGVKLFDREGQKLTDAAEEEIEALFDTPFGGPPGNIDHVGVATDSYLEHIVERFGSDLTGSSWSEPPDHARTAGPSLRSHSIRSRRDRSPRKRTSPSLS